MSTSITFIREIQSQIIWLPPSHRTKESCSRSKTTSHYLLNIESKSTLSMPFELPFAPQLIYLFISSIDSSFLLPIKLMTVCVQLSYQVDPPKAWRPRQEPHIPDSPCHCWMLNTVLNYIMTTPRTVSSIQVWPYQPPLSFHPAVKSLLPCLQPDRR